MTDAIILNNSGNDTYAMVAREWLTSPILAVKMRILLSTPDQINNLIKIRHEKTIGKSTNRDISIGNYVDARNKSNLIIDIPLDPPLALDGHTYFQTDIEANSEIDLLFYFSDQANLADLL